MSDLVPFLKLLTKVGYPNPKISNLAKMSDYNLEEFLPDLVVELGQKTKSGSMMSRQAHMELIIHDGIAANLGDVIFYVNNGTKAALMSIATGTVSRRSTFIYLLKASKISCLVMI